MYYGEACSCYVLQYLIYVVKIVEVLTKNLPRLLLCIDAVITEKHLTSQHDTSMLLLLLLLLLWKSKVGSCHDFPTLYKLEKTA
jgi:hypothetical protein